MGTNEKDMTAGSPGKLIITFAIPMMLGNIFQQFYTMADTMIVGQVVGVEALAAVGAGDWLVWLVLGIMTGITQGFSILVSQYYGAREKENLKCAVAKSYIMTALLSVVVLAVSEGTVYHVLLFLQTPDNVIDLTMLYLRLIFAGIPIIAAYNIFAAILRALGNSRSPLIAMTVAAVINVGLDLLFVAVFGWGIAGAAVATVIAQGFSALYCLIVLRKIPDIRLEKKDFYRQPSMSLRLLELAVPLAIQNVIISVGGLVVQYVINGFGFLFVAGFADRKHSSNAALARSFKALFPDSATSHSPQISTPRIPSAHISLTLFRHSSIVFRRISPWLQFVSASSLQRTSLSTEMYSGSFPTCLLTNAHTCASSISRSFSLLKNSTFS